MAEPSAATAWRFAAWDPAASALRRGTIAAATADAVRAELLRRGWEPERIAAARPAVPRWLAARIADWRRSRRRPAVADLCEALAALVQVGMPLDQALEHLASSPLRAAAEAGLLLELAGELRAGGSFSGACAARGDWFDRYDVALLAAGQRAGELVPVLRAVAEIHQRRLAAMQRLGAALAYPAIVAASGLGVFVFLTQSVLPRITGIITAARAEPPWLTAAVMRAGDALAAWWPLALGLAAAAAWAWSRAPELVPVGGRLGRLVHGNPWARLRARVRVAVASAALARLLRVGVPLAEALAVSAATVPDRALRALLARAAVAVEDGRDLSTVLAASPLVEADFAHMLRLGEGSGDLPGMLDRIAARYREASDRGLEQFTAIAGPIAIIVLAVLVGVLVLAVGQALSRVADLV